MNVERGGFGTAAAAAAASAGAAAPDPATPVALECAAPVSPSLVQQLGTAAGAVIVAVGGSFTSAAAASPASAARRGLCTRGYATMSLDACVPLEAQYAHQQHH